jgi:hypothetical protein
MVPSIAIACSAAPDDVTGGEARFDASPPIAPATGCATGGGATWSDLYRDCFGRGHADCGGTAGCHSASADTGTSFSGFLCGQTKDDCYKGIVGTTSIVPVGGSTKPETTRLYVTLRKTPPLASPPRAMPDQSGFEFDADALARIRTWIQNGAKND